MPFSNPEPSLRRNTPGVPTLFVATTNDNMGALIPTLDEAGNVVFGADRSPASGNDDGYTAGIALGGAWRDDHGEVVLALSSDLFTRMNGTSYLRDDGRAVNVADAVDLTSASVSLVRRTGPLLATHFNGELGVKNSRLMMNIQNAWHSVIPAGVFEHHATAMSAYASAGVGERAVLDAGALRLSGEVGVRASSVGDASYAYAIAAARLDAGPIALRAEHEQRLQRRGALAQQTTLGAAVDVGGLGVTLDGTVRGAGWNNSLTQYDGDRDLLLSAGLVF
ncbi:MAG: hypothetical protein IT381_25990 [Deltaproteobacteria bacterium]|nr:hypothetical protein [Deltaproteobacteria bacterium]